MLHERHRAAFIGVRRAVRQDAAPQGTDDREGDQKGPRPIVVIDISETGNKGIWFEELERKIIIDLLQALIVTSSRGLQTSDLANVLVVLDEAARHAPSARTLEF
jgi:hypothetical protein